MALRRCNTIGYSRFIANLTEATVIQHKLLGLCGHCRQRTKPDSVLTKQPSQLIDLGIVWSEFKPLLGQGNLIDDYNTDTIAQRSSQQLSEVRK